jgi:hypothetical protein
VPVLLARKAIVRIHFGQLAGIDCNFLSEVFAGNGDFHGMRPVD